MYCRSYRQVKCNCGCTQTRSCKLLLIDLPLLRVVVEQLLLLWSRKLELDLAHDNCFTNDEKNIVTSQDLWHLQSLSIAPHNPRASRVDPDAIPSWASDPSAIASISHHHLGISCWGNSGSNVILGSFTLGVIADVQPKWSVPSGAKVEISPKGFTLGVKAELGKIFSICPKLLINAELYGLVLAPRLGKGYHGIWEANLQPLGPMFQHLLISWRQCSSIC